VALSGLVGLAAFPNGELAKTSGASATAYIARAFVRHTIGLGGEREAVEGEANQLKSDYDARRIVLTVGKLSVLDVFDDNAHAHDPRTQFMNWTLMTNGAYDYPADARGYTDGLAAELRDGPWTARLARFAEPRTPNALALDNDLLRHYGDQLELVRAYALAGQPGAVHVLAFRGRALMSTWADALAAAPSGSAPSLAAVRAGSHVKTGIGVNIEQQLRGDVGMFLRALRADGKTETEAFAESDGSFAAGVSVKGGHNVVGAAVGADVLSGAHRSYLERGGMSAFLGDGALRYGSERLAEIFYKLALGEGLELSADCQRIANPGYNMDRGPATFYAIRLHWED